MSQTHGFVGKGKDAGEWGKPCPRRIEERAGEKNSTYGPFHQDQNMEFVPLIGDTRCQNCKSVAKTSRWRGRRGASVTAGSTMMWERVGS